MQPDSELNTNTPQDPVGLLGNFIFQLGAWSNAEFGICHGVYIKGEKHR